MILSETRLHIVLNYTCSFNLTWSKANASRFWLDRSKHEQDLGLSNVSSVICYATKTKAFPASLNVIDEFTLMIN